MPPDCTGYHTERSAVPMPSRFWVLIGRTRFVPLISAAAFIASCSQESTAPAESPRPGPRAFFQLRAAMDTYQWGDTVENPRRIASIPEELEEGDWPGFRGADRNGRAPGVRFGTDWAANPPRELWRRRVGTGRSSFAVIAGYVFTQEQRGPNEVVVCYDAATGEEVWTNSVAQRFTNIQGDGPRATPTFARGHLYTQGAMGTLQCLDATSGSVIWQRKLQLESGTKLPQFGFSGSPLVFDDLVIVFAGGPEGKGVVAFSADTGSLVWTAGQAKITYASPQPARFGDTDQVLLISNFGIEAFTPENGDVLWEHAWTPAGFARCIQPVITERDSVIIGRPPEVETRCLHIEFNGESWSCEEEWTRDGFAPYFNDAVYHNGFCYGTHRNSLSCIDAATGEQEWKERVSGGQMVLLPDMDAVLSVTERGNVMVFSASPDGFEQRASMPDVFKGQTLNHPVIAHGKLFLRNEHEAICYALPE